MKSSKLILPRKLLAMALSLAVAVTWMIPSFAVYADDGDESAPQEATEVASEEAADEIEEEPVAEETAAGDETEESAEEVSEPSEEETEAGEEAGEEVVENEAAEEPSAVNDEEANESEEAEEDEEPAAEPATALPAAVNGTITLTGDVNLAEVAVITEDTDIDLAGHTITGTTGGRAIRVDSGSLMLTDSSAEQTGKIVVNGTESKAIIANAPAVIKGGTIEVSGQESAGIMVYNGVTVMINGAAINADGVGAMGVDDNWGDVNFKKGEINASGQGAIGIYMEGYENTATLNGGIITVKGDGSGYGIEAIEQGPTGHTINIKGGTISTSGSRTYAVYLEMDNTLNISGGTFESKNAAAIAFFQGGNKAVITGGSITGGENAYGININNAANNELEISGDTVVSGGTGAISAGGNRYKSTPAVTISGGYFNGAIAGGVPTDKTDNFAKYNITGGYFTDKIENSALYNYSLAKDYTPESYTDEVKQEEMMSLVETDKEVNGVKYGYTLSELEYVLMNIPYDKFYASELGEKGAAVDAVTSATKSKTRGTLAGGSYHVNSDGTDISGVIYPVKAPAYALKELTQVTDESKVEISVTNRGKETTTTYEGKDALFESADYSYYVLSGTPESYKTMTIAEDGSFNFGETSAETSKVEGVTGDVTVGGKHTDIEIKLSGTEGIAQGDAVSAVVLTDSEGNKYGLRHVVNIWRATELGWNLGELDLGGKTITNIRYITQNAVIDYPVEIAISEPAYVLMNIPYSEFYKEEVAGEVAGVDTVTSATKTKKRFYNLAEGSFHASEDSAGIDGVVYPVFIEDKAAFAEAAKAAGAKEVTDSDELNFEINRKGTVVPYNLKGSEVLFEAPAYSYYVLSEAPANYKKLTINEDGSFAFAKIANRTISKTIESPAVKTTDKHVDLAFTMPGDDVKSATVNAVVITANDGKKYGLSHVVHIWNKTELGWDVSGAYEDLQNTTVTNVTYYTSEGVFSYDVNIALPTKEVAAAEKAAANAASAKDKADAAKDAADAAKSAAEEAAKTPGEEAIEAAKKYEEAVSALKTAAETALTAAETALEKAKEAYEEGSEKITEAQENADAANALVEDAEKAETEAADAVKKAEDDKAAADKKAADEKAAAEKAAAEKKAAEEKAAAEKAATDKKVAEEKAAEAKAKKVKTVTVNVKTVNAKAINKAVKKAGGSSKYVTKIVLGKKVKKIKKNAFKNYTKVKTIEIKSKKLKKASVKNSLKGSKVTTVKVSIGSKKGNKKYVKKYKALFTKKNAGRKAKVK